ncbi:TPA: helix-turn-helix transcriptional regulator [Klebsiella pneumoniae]|uniref:helix-turn-helix domain-containing protein n=1 Tax=Klebsiella TaxID=570 RepID=UPI000E347F4A|nr:MULTISPECIES: helix-turn-helix transcriptional regulator [Klebsiella]MDI0348065.1 helix-turn-helix transcriptional regulator [Raoultella ornithinolytica]EKT7903999.1 helix-turn-helix transcriptional regulator [Klebsiella oxytoca]MDI0399246.1 helix-turn-helix transcriptional regulator [Raoultella ornithinolytica]MDI0426100.1 helix-turn-helix transcriptional regulator [Raoultella ornithinolytica]MDI0443186.1 helix-turn-helix transcriptional regulator [Raoultella ornithinolytica]
MSNSIGERVVSIRKKADLNQRDFAARLGISNGGISQIENGKAMPGGDFLLRIHQEFGVDITWLLTGVSNHAQVNEVQPMSPEKKELLDAFDGMTPEQRRAILEVGKGLAQPKPSKFAG